MLYDPRYGYYGEEKEKPRFLDYLSTAAKIAAVAAGGILGARFLAQSGILDQLSTGIAPRLTAYGRAIARGEAIREAGEKLSSALSRAAGEELASELPRPFILDVIEQRHLLHESLQHAPRRSLALQQISKSLGREAGSAVELVLSQNPPGYFYAASQESFVEALSGTIGEERAKAAYSIIESFRSFEFASSGILEKIDKVIAEELAKRKPAQGVLQGLLGVRTASIQELISRGLIEPTEELAEFLKKYPELLEVVGDPRIFIAESGRILDLRNLTEAGKSLLGWAGGTLPGKIAHLEDILESSQAPFIYRLRAGQVQPFLTGSMEPLAEDILVIGGRAVSLLNPEEVVAENVALLQNRGVFERLARHIAGVPPSNDEAVNVVGSIARKLGIADLLDLGKQTEPSYFDRLYSIWAKYGQEGWYGNVFQRAFRGELGVSDFERIEGFFSRFTQGFSEPALRILREYLPENLRDISFYGREGIIRAAEKLAPDSEDIARLLSGLKSGEYIDLDRARRVLSHEVVRRLGVNAVREIMDRAVQEGRIAGEQARAALDLVNDYIFSLTRKIRGIPGARELAEDEVIRLFTSREPGAVRFQQEVADMVQRYAGPWSHGILIRPERLTSGSYIAVRRGTGFTEALGSVAAGNESTKLLGLFKELTAGRHRLQDVTLNTLVPYHLLERVNRALASAGLALGPESLGSTADILYGLIFKRALPAYLAVQAAAYLSWEFGKLTGLTAEQRYYRTKAQVALDIAAARDITGVTALAKRIHRMMPGLEVLGDVPFIGGLFRQPMSREELVEFLRYGEEPVRQGRFWLLSNTPWRGQRIQYWKPNWYRLGISQYKLTDVLYGSPEEYWAHRWFPTPRYPLAPLRALLEPYWLEFKHYHDRPYPVSGPLISEEILFAPLINATIGRIIKPPIRMHREELRRLNEETKERAREKESQVYYATESGGRLQVVAGIHEALMPFGGLEEPSGGPLGIVYGGAGIPVGAAPGGPAVGVSGGRGAGGAGYVLAASHTASANESVRARALERAGYIETRGGTVESYLGEPESSYSMLYTAGQLGRNIRNLLGIWGWGIEVFGAETRPQLVEATAGRIYSMERAWSDLAFGGTVLQVIPGLSEVAEIGRRFLTRRPAAIQEYNPLRNLMPEWLPGSNYFLDLRHGDPFAKIPLGEVRLPGEGYEVTHPLYPDVDSELGWFTRFAILSDVAPWSNEWRAYSRIVSQRREELPEYLQKRVGQIRKQIAARKRHYELYPYRFVGQRTARITGTVERFIDPNTFLIREMPGVPIRLAGVRLTSEHPVSDYLEEGQRVTLLVEPDLERARDTMRTLRAVVLEGRRNLNLSLLRSGVVKEKPNEWTAPGVVARFSPFERFIGGLWERFAHLNIPFLHRKFLPVDSPLEYYERRIVYGKEFASWEHPLSDYLIPTFQSYAVRAPWTAAVLGGFTGGVIGRTLLGGGLSTKYGAIAGGALAALLSIGRLGIEAATGERWVPARIRRQWEVETYFDILEYVKYRGLYEYAARKALALEDTDIEALYERAQMDAERRSQRKALLEREKRRAMIAGEKERVKEINKLLRQVESLPRLMEPVGPWGRFAIAARQRYESTLYGANVYSTYAVVRALSARSREFYQHFIKEDDPRKRRRILSILPPLERRIYQAAWGMPVDRLPSLEEFFKKRRLPPPNWPGWRPEVDLSLVKLKVVKNEALDLHDYNFFPMDELKAQFAPGIPAPFKPIHYAGGIKKAIEAVLKGRGLTNISVESIPIVAPNIDIDFDLMIDRTEEISDLIEAGEWAS